MLIGVNNVNKYKIAAWATGGHYGTGVYEIHNEKGQYEGLISIALLKEKGLVRRIDHNEKAEEFLNTDEGRKFFLQNRRISLCNILCRK